MVNLDVFKAFDGFGWYVAEIDGHDYEQLEKELTTTTDTFPEVIIANTIKGKGVSFFEDPPEHQFLGKTGHVYHYKHIDDEDYKKAMSELV